MLQGIVGLTLLVVGLYTGEANWFIASGIYEISSILSLWREDKNKNK